MNLRGFLRTSTLIALLALLTIASPRAFGKAQESPESAAQSSSAQSTDKSAGAELAKETREAAGEEEENENLKHSSAIQLLAKKTGMTVHRAHLVAVTINFLIVAFLIYWFARKSIPAAFRSRTDSIQRGLEEGRAASEDANRRLADIESRLSKLDSEVARMQAQSENEAAAEEGRIKQAAEADIRKIVEAAEQEIASAAKQARRDLSSHTADLAVALARKQIHVDSPTDQILVRNFAGKLASGSGGSGSGGKDRQ